VWVVLLNYNKGASRVAIDDYDSLRQDPMNGLIHIALWFRLEIPSREFGALRGALHLNLFDTSPLQVHTHANFLHACVYSGTERICDNVHASASKLFAFAGMRLVPPKGAIEGEDRP